MGAEALGEWGLSKEDEEDSRCSVGVDGGGRLVIHTARTHTSSSSFQPLVPKLAYREEYSSVQYASGVRRICHLTMSVSVSVSVCKSQAIHQTVSTTVAGFMDETPRQSTITHSGPPTLVTRN